MPGETRGAKTLSVSLFDLLLQPPKKKPAVGEKAASRTGVKGHHIIEAPLKSFVANGRRRKGLSSFKKKILLERLEHHRKPPTSSSFPEAGSREVRLVGFIDEEALPDPDELQELLLNARELLSPFDGLLSLSYQDRDVLALFSSEETARLAAATLRELVVGGETLRVETAVDTNAEEKSTDTPADVCVLRLLNLVMAADVEDQEAAAEVLSDLGVLLGGFGFSRLWVEASSAPTLQGSEPAAPEQLMCSCQRVVPAMVLVSVLVSGGASLVTVGQAMREKGTPQGVYSDTAFGRHVYSGAFFADSRDCSLEFQVCLLGFAEADQLEDEDERRELIENVLALCSGADQGSLRVSFSHGNSATSHDAVISVPSCAQAVCLAGTLIGLCVGGNILDIELRVVRAAMPSLRLSSSREGRIRIVLGILDFVGADGLPLSPLPKLSLVEQVQEELPGCWIERVVAAHPMQPSCESLMPFGCCQDSLEVCVGFSTVASATAALAEMDGRVVGGAVVEAFLTRSTNAGPETGVVSGTLNVSSKALVSASAMEDKLGVAKYAEARTMPKLPRHDHPLDLATDVSGIKVGLVFTVWYEC